MIKRVLIVSLVILGVMLSFLLLFKSELSRKILKESYKEYYVDKEKDIYFEKPVINEMEYDFTEKEEKKNKPEKIIFHHCARSIWSPEDINEYHKERGFIGIGYHFYIRKDGSVYKGRSEDAIGAHTKGENNISIGICLEGKFEIENISEEQIESLMNLSIYIINKYEIKDINGHRFYAETLCPGKNFDEKKLEKDIIKKLREF
ncbi:N-acetylmuramoyl-L-alanine amidase [Clostridium sp.]|uniref:N-acetylmuramoyl-L-alanine amidase n=1 Tax=Clostridium sp. TaxID=1506 RepID=UPI002604C5D9|nr:N-acetylmuramoyl-L-alanine amidase [Clostridium sp.]